MRRLNKNFIMSNPYTNTYDMQITGVAVLVGLSIILFEVFPEQSVWSFPVREADEHVIAVPGSGGFSFLLTQKTRST
jgi:hypothetical protein